MIRSDGTFVRDYLYVRDAVSAYMCLAEEVPRSDVRGEAFNFSLDSPVTVREIVDKISRTMKSDLQPEVLDQAKSEIRSQSLSSTKARKLLNWSPGWSFERGLEETVGWYRDYLT